MKNRDDDFSADFTPGDAELLLLACEPVTPLASTKHALFAALTGPWFAPFVRRVAELCEVSREAAQGLLSAVDDAGRWMIGPGPGIEAFHIDAGPSLEGAIVGFIRLAPGAVFPDHKHVGSEDVLVLQGGFVADGPGGRVVVRAGEEAPMSPGSHHLLTALPEGCLYLGVVRDGLDFGDGLVGPDDPRV